MSDDQQPTTGQRTWVEPTIEVLDVRETAAFIGRGADVGGNPSPDCQRS
jgi:hypothetical protein